MTFWLAVTLLGAYALFMLGLAQWVERRPGLREKVAASPLVYTLSLAVYMTTWTYYGSVGQAANNGLIYLTAYLGPTLCVLTWPWLLGRMLRLKGTVRVTSIADYLGARYGRSHLVAGMAASMALLGALPYVALQMKAVLSSLAILLEPGCQAMEAGSLSAQWAGPWLLLFMVGFIIIAGVRRIDPTERHQGVIAVVALESVVKLACFLAVGIYVCYAVFETPWDIFLKASEAGLGHLLAVGGSEADYQDWVGRLLLFMPVILLLPRQFHVAVVENSRPEHIRTAVWLLPLYMLLISLFVMPIALGGRVLGLPAGVGDSFVLLLPQLGGNQWLSFLVFLGGFSAAMSMIAINAMTMATMVSNDLLLPLAARIPRAEWAGRHLLPLRWAVVAAYLGCGYMVHLAIGETTMLASMGTLSMVAVVQFTPAAILGLFWRGGNKAGAVAGLGAGFAVWLHTLALPVLARNGVLDPSFLAGPFGLAWLAPESLFGLAALTPLNHTLFWSVILNTGAYVLVSLMVRPSPDEMAMTVRFFSAFRGIEEARITADSPRHILLAPRRQALEEILKAYLPDSAARRNARICVERAGCTGLERVSVLELAAVYAEAERMLGGIVGAATAHKAVLDDRLFTPQEREELSSLYGRVLADMNVSPEELRLRVDYYKEREVLLLENAQALTAANQALGEEVRVRTRFEQEARQAVQTVRDIIDSMPSAMIALTKDLKIIHWSREAAARFGVSAEQAEGRPLGDLVPGLAWTVELVEMALDTGEARMKGRTVDDSGPSRRYLDVMAYPLARRGEVVLRLDDVTERVRVEDMMVQTEKMFSIGGLAAGMAHEINNPLGAIVGTAQNMERRVEHGRPGNEAAAAECGVSVDAVRCYMHKRGILDMIGSIRCSGVRAADIVRNMLEFSRKSEGLTVMADASRLLDKAVELAGQDYDLKTKFDFRQIRIIREYDPHLPPLVCRPMEIEQVILNLLRNAAQAMTGSGETKPEIRLSAMREDGLARIEVRDNGPGMDEATRKRVFEPFFTTKPVGIGTGLGLSVSYFIVTSNHGGQFSVESRPGMGARFIIRLPLAGAQATGSLPGQR